MISYPGNKMEDQFQWRGPGGRRLERREMRLKQVVAMGTLSHTNWDLIGLVGPGGVEGGFC